jgi:hypothetical protein
MGPYFPRSEYMSRAAFEARGCVRLRPVTPPIGCLPALRVRAPKGSRLRRISLFAGKRRLVTRKVRDARAVRMIVPRTRARRVRVVMTTTRGRRVRATRRLTRCPVRRAAGTAGTRR